MLMKRLLQMLDLSQNKLTELSNIPQPRISRINLAENEIASCAGFKGHPIISSLILSQNKLTSCAGLGNMERLTELTLRSNELTSLKEMVNLPSLKKLDVNTNKLENLNDLPDLPSLEKFDCGANEITTIAELPKLAVFRRLKELLMQGTPLAEEKGDDMKLEVLIALDELSIKMVNEEEVVAEDR